MRVLAPEPSRRLTLVSCLAVLATLLAAGCSGLLSRQPAAPDGEPSPPAPSSTAAFAPAPTSSGSSNAPTQTPPTGPTAAPAAGPVALRVWVPPAFDPHKDTPAGHLLDERLKTFGRSHPEASIEVRVKAIEGPGGLLDSLANASAAAPLALPDLVALPHNQLETAALKGLLHSFDGQTEALESADWYEYARQMGQLQNSTYGLPFGGDALVMIYRPALVKEPPAGWPAALAGKEAFIFAAADPGALFTLSQYLAAGGPVRDDQGRPTLDPKALNKVLTFYQEGEQGGQLPYWLTQYQNDLETWEAFTENRANMVVAWSSRFLASPLTGTALAPLPTPDGVPFTLATGWVWALASPQIEHQALSAQLAEYLTESAFLAQWTEAAGLLPPRPSALKAWQNTSLQNLIHRLSLSAQVYPSSDVLTSLGPPLEQAVVEVLKKQSEPVAAAQAAAQNLQQPK